MNKKNKITLLLVVVLSLVAFWFVIHNRNGTIKEALKDFAVEDTASITKIFLADRYNNTITLEKVKTGMWKLNDKYFARNDAVSMLLYTIKMLEVKQPVGKNARPFVIKQLAAGAIKIEIYKDDKLTKVYYVGGETQDHLGTYMLLSDPETGENSSIPFVMYIPGFDGYLTTRYFTDLSDWRGRIVFKYIPTEIKSIKVEFSENSQSSYLISLLGRSNFELKQLKTDAIIPFDTMAMKQYISNYQDIRFESLLNDLIEKSKKDSILSQKPDFSIEVTDVNGNKNNIKMYRKLAGPDELDINGEPLKYDLDRMYALTNDGKDFILIQYYVFGKLLQPLDYFTVKKVGKPIK